MNDMRGSAHRHLVDPCDQQLRFIWVHVEDGSAVRAHPRGTARAASAGGTALGVDCTLLRGCRRHDDPLGSEQRQPQAAEAQAGILVSVICRRDAVRHAQVLQVLMRLLQLLPHVRQLLPDILLLLQRHLQQPRRRQAGLSIVSTGRDALWLFPLTLFTGKL